MSKQVCELSSENLLRLGLYKEFSGRSLVLDLQPKTATGKWRLNIWSLRSGSRNIWLWSSRMQIDSGIDLGYISTIAELAAIYKTLTGKDWENGK